MATESESTGHEGQGARAKSFLRGLRERSAAILKKAEWYGKLSPSMRIALSLAIVGATIAGTMVGGTAGGVILTAAFFAKIAVGTAATYYASQKASEIAYNLGSNNPNKWGVAVGGVIGALTVLGLERIFEHASLAFMHSDLGLDHYITGATSHPTGWQVHRLPSGEYVADNNGMRSVWNGTSWSTPRPIPIGAEMVAGSTATNIHFNADNATWLKNVAHLNDEQIGKLLAKGFTDAEIDQWQQTGWVPHVDATGRLTVTNGGATMVWAQDASGKWAFVAEGTATPAPTAAPEVTTQAATATAPEADCTGLATIVESKAAHGCDGSEALLRDLANRLVAAGATADTYPQGSVLDRLVEAKLQGSGALGRAVVQISQDLGMLKPTETLDSANIWDGARFRVDGGKLFLVGPGTPAGGDLLSDCNRIDGFNGVMIDTHPCGETPTPTPHPVEHPVATAPVPPVEAAPEPTPAPIPPVEAAVTPPAEPPCPPPQWYMQTGAWVVTEDARFKGGILATVIRGMSESEAAEYLRKVVAEGAIPSGYQTGAHRVIWVAMTDCEGGHQVFKCFDIDAGRFQESPLGVFDEHHHLHRITSLAEFHQLLDGTHPVAPTTDLPKPAIELGITDADRDTIPDAFTFARIPKAEIIERQFMLIWNDVFGSDASSSLRESVVSTEMTPELVRAIQHDNIAAAARILESQLHISHEQAVNLARWIDMYESGRNVPFHVSMFDSDGSPKTIGQFIADTVSQNADNGLYPEMRPEDVGKEVTFATAPTPEAVASPYQADVAPAPHEVDAALQADIVRAFGSEAAFEAKLRLIGNIPYAIIINNDVSDMSSLTTDAQKEAYTQIRNFLLEHRSGFRFPAGTNSSSSVLHILQATGVIAD